MGKSLQTKRVTLRPLVMRDVPFIEEMLSDKASAEMQNVAFDAEISRDFATSLVLMNKDSVWTRSLALAIVDKNTNAPIGLAYLCPFVPKERARLAYSIHRSHWNKGFMTEAARAVVDFAIKQLGIKYLTAAVTESNLASRRVLEKLGFRFTGHYEAAATDTLIRQEERVLLYELR